MIRTAVLLAALFLSACASNRHFEEGTRLSAAGQSEAALQELERAVTEKPGDPRYRAALLREREVVVGKRIAAGDALARQERFDEAEAEYRAGSAADPANQRVAGRLNELTRSRHAHKLLKESRELFGRNDLAGAEGKLRVLLAESPGYPGARDLLRRILEASMAAGAGPELKAPFRKPVSLEFRDASLKTVFDMLSRTSGINFVFDRDVRSDTKVSVFLRNTRLEDALKLILTTNQLDRKILNENSVLVYPNTPAKQKDYRDLVVRSFYLANADVKQAAAMVKSMVKTQDVFIDEKLNLMIIKDTPEVVRLADQLVRTLDVADAEVMLEVEVLEITRSRLQDLGIRWPASVSLGAQDATGAISSAATIPVDSPMMFTTSNPALVFNLRANVSRTDLLANPRIRVKNKEKARIHIGDKVPVFTTTATANVGVATSVSYLDVGLKLDVEPTIAISDEVAIKVGLEVSNIVETITVSSGTGNTVAYRLGTRNTNTALQLRDGETQILAGLINDEDRRASQRVPGLGDLPVLGRLFGTENENKVKTEIVLLITPRIVRNVSRPEGVMAEMPVGTDTTPGLPPLRIAKTAPGSVVVAPGAGAGGQPLPPEPDNAGRVTDSAFQVGLTAPARVQKGSQFNVTVTIPEVVDIKDGFVELAFDPSVLEVQGAQPRLPGRLQIPASALARMTDVTFRVIGAAGASSPIAISAMELVDASGFAVGASPPAPLRTEVTP